MLRKRIIPIIQLKGSSVVKTVQFQNPRIVGDAVSTIKVFSSRMADEMIITDIEATKRNSINFDLLKRLTKECIMPLTIGGGIKTEKDVEKLFRIGADKILINTQFYKDPNFIKKISKIYGKQSIVFSLDVTKNTNSEFVPVSMSGSKKEILNLIQSKDFLHMPIINKNKKVVGLHTLQSLTAQNKFHNPVVLMAGGYGRRLLPLTKKVPKPLIKIADKSIIELIIRHLAEQGFVNFYISTFYKHDLLKKKLGSGRKYGVKISYLTERKPLGTAGSLSLIKKKYKNIPFIVMNADLLTKLDFAELLEFHKKNKSIATVCVRDFNYKIPYGVIKSKKNVLQSIEEKPKINHFVSAGIYILNYSVIKKIKKNQFLNMPTLIQRLINNKSKIFTFPIYEYWNDIGRFINLKKAKIDIQRGSY